MKTDITKNTYTRKIKTTIYLSVIYNTKKAIKIPKEVLQLLVFRLIIALICITKTKNSWNLS